MSSKLVSSIALAACLLASGGAFAEVLYQQAPTADATGESANNPVVTGEPLLFLHAQTRGELDYALDYARSAGEIVQVLR